ncbi:protein SPT2 homolog [Camellia sinensis]|uniref:protein SPT2 homolog n=1 Tax=Camellia sinensis TaxID=4442 RepID=UPI0010366C8B|nr:protein SPT2 homolog [Camellia sinensis]
MTCVCRQWEISGLPCKHAVATICHSRINIEDFVHPYFSKATYLRANNGMIHPILDHSMWTLIPGDPVQHPPLKRFPRRPRTSRKRAAHEPSAGTSQSKRSSTLRCKWCMQFGHNKRTCQRGPVRGGASADGRGSGTSSGRGSAKTTGTGSDRSLSRGRGSGRSVSWDRGRDNSSERGSSAERGNASGKDNSSGRDGSAGRGNTTTRGSSTRKGSSGGRGKGKVKYAQDIPRGTPPMPTQCVTQVTEHHMT